jgi:hypothetical protein
VRRIVIEALRVQAGPDNLPDSDAVSVEVTVPQDQR